MGERRKWDKQSEFHPPAGTTAATASEGSSDPVLEKQRQYIRMLEERNRLKKKLVAASRSQREKDQLQEREEAFVTTFNVPKATSSVTAIAGSGGSGGSGSGGLYHSSTVRKNKSATSLLPTRSAAPPSCGSSSSAASLSTRPQSEAVERQSQCKSAPTMALHMRDSSARDASEQRRQRPARAKWSKPQGPMNIAVENRDGRAHLCLTDQTQPSVANERAQSDAKHVQASTSPTDRKRDASDDDGKQDDSSDVDVDNDIEESYLEESFEDFDEEEAECEEILAAEAKCDDTRDRKLSSKHQLTTRDSEYPKLAHPDSKDNTPPTNAQDSLASQSSSTPATPATPDLSHTTTELFGIIQHLSRSKQKALTDVLQKFQSSERRDSDVKELQSSIGDPQIWKQITLALFSDSERGDAAQHTKAARKPAEDEMPSAIVQVLQEQKRWEEEYAQQMKEQLAQERLEKENAMRAAEKRRMAMMKQLEEEEHELERLMERKRQERLAKLRALEQEVESVPVSLPTATNASKSGGQRAAPVDRKDGSCVRGSGNEATRATDNLLNTEEKTRGKSVSPATRSPKKKKKSGSACQSKSRGLEDDIESALRQESKQASINEPGLAASRPVVPLLNLGAASANSVHDSDTTFATSSPPIEVRIKLLSAWGTTRAIGLTQISVYDANGDELEVDAASVKLYDESEHQALPKSHDMVRGLGRLFNGVAHTNSEQNMWLGRLSSTGSCW